MNCTKFYIEELTFLLKYLSCKTFLTTVIFVIQAFGPYIFLNRGVYDKKNTA